MSLDPIEGTIEELQCPILPPPPVEISSAMKMPSKHHKPLGNDQAGELSEDSLISEIFVSISEKERQAFLLKAYSYGFRDFSIF
jgi:hypothetical protein